jgi:hypothetical protein
MSVEKFLTISILIPASELDRLLAQRFHPDLPLPVPSRLMVEEAIQPRAARQAAQNGVSDAVSKGDDQDRQP